MTTNAKLEMDDSNKTGTSCSETGTYCCKMHPSTEKYVSKGNIFPQCDQKGLPHKTIWWKIIK